MGQGRPLVETCSVKICRAGVTLTVPVSGTHAIIGPSNITHSIGRELVLDLLRFSVYSYV